MTEVDNARAGVKLVEEGLRLLNSGPFEYTMKKLLAAETLLLTRFAPFKVGNRVVVEKLEEIKSGSGWYHTRHWLKPGAAGIVRGTDCDSDGVLRFYVEFDGESWIDQDGRTQPVEQKHVYCMFEQNLVLEVA